MQLTPQLSESAQFSRACGSLHSFPEGLNEVTPKRRWIGRLVPCFPGEQPYPLTRAQSEAWACLLTIKQLQKPGGILLNSRPRSKNTTENRGSFLSQRALRCAHALNAKKPVPSVYTKDTQALNKVAATSALAPSSVHQRHTGDRLSCIFLPSSLHTALFSPLVPYLSSQPSCYEGEFHPCPLARPDRPGSTAISRDGHTTRGRGPWPFS